MVTHRFKLLIAGTLTAVMACALFVAPGSATESGVSASETKPGLSARETKLIRAIDQSYAYDLTYRLSTAPGPNDGEVVAGTANDLTRANYLKDEMEELGLTNVTVDSFPVTSWDFNSALVEVTSPVSKQLIEVRSAVGTPPTPNGQPLSGQLVDGGLGRIQDLAAIPGGVDDKIVLVERSREMFFGVPALLEAKVQGAAAVLLYSPPLTNAGLNADVSNADIPALNITGVDAKYLKDLLEAGPVTLDVTSDHSTDENARANVVYGMIEGSKYPDEYVVNQSHMDHWWDGANDTNSGIGASLAIAKAAIDANLTPKRTLVFMFFSGEESSGGVNDTWWNWSQGPYRYFMEHPEWLPKIVQAFYSGGVGLEAETLYVETSPDLADFMTTAVNDAQVSYLVDPYVYNTVSSFDTWGLYWHGRSAASIYQAEDLFGDENMVGDHIRGAPSIADIRPEYLAVDARIRGLASWRIANADLVPNSLTAESREVRIHLAQLERAVPDAKVGALRKALGRYQARAAAYEARLGKLTNASTARIHAANRKKLRVLSTVSPYLYDQDLGLWDPTPGWWSVTKYETFANDIPAVQAAIKSLKNGHGARARASLRKVVTMSWGTHVSAAGYARTLGAFYTNPELSWAEGHMPWITKVKAEYDSIRAKAAAASKALEPADYTAEIASLKAKLKVTKAKLAAKIAEVQAAFKRGAKLLK